MADLFLGIDTSNYKTSVAVVDDSGRPVYFRSEFLAVPEGSRGLRQSECFFRHSCVLPDYFYEMASDVDISSIRAAGVSSRPRRTEGSYMPCFLAGVNAARELSALLGIPLYEFSHQEGHAAAIIEDSGALDIPEKSILMHLSGGTTEFLLCRMDEKGYDTEIIGGTRDISIGQLIDRTGVAAGYPFPAGQYLDDAACGYNGPPSSVLPRVKITDGYFNLSGPETRIMRAVQNSPAEEHPAMIYELFALIADILVKSAVSLSEAYGVKEIYMAGGVSASSFIRERIRSVITPDKDINIVFGEPSLSGDNAVGTARLAKRVFINETGNCYTGK